MASMNDTNAAVRNADQASATARGASARRRLPRWMVPLLAVAGALLVWALGQLAGVGTVAVDTGAALQTVTITSVVAASLLAALAGWGARAVIGRIGKNPTRAQRIWLVLSGVALLASLLGVAGAVTTGALVVLATEHVVVGLIVMLGLRR
ncbi:DUF6069 family protein [Pseudactinotalea suaedae]|jgi:hypothetical protein|uniref:DUF6069 family protein n=1 Tax=Pseudactinotalea suaedae TaxID=1524924 RepID=UPI001F4F9D05|nr:DUF6069 family protein [Pseudactinotalea suaedae]